MLSIKHPKFCKLVAIAEVLKYARGGHGIIFKADDKINNYLWKKWQPAMPLW